MPGFSLDAPSPLRSSLFCTPVYVERGWARRLWAGLAAVFLLCGAGAFGLAPVTVSPTALNFGNQVVNTKSAPLAATLTNNQATGVTLTAPTLTGEFALAGGTCGTTLAPGGSCTYLVAFTPAALGTRSSVLNLAFNASNSPISVPLSGVGVTAVGVSPAAVTFATQSLGTSSSPATVTVTNYQATTLTLGAPTTTGDFSVTGGTCANALGAGASCTYLVTFTPEAVGTRTGTLAVNDSAATSPQTAALSGVAVNAPWITSVTPGSGVLGAAVPVTITGGNTHFATGVSTVSAGAGITVTNVKAPTNLEITATFTIASNATPGPRTITVTTGSETVVYGSGFIVTSSPPLAIMSIVPPSGAQGQQLPVTVTGSGTHFAPGQTTANFGGGVTVNQVTVTDNLHASVLVTVGSTTTLGARNVSLLTGGELAVLNSGFAVTAGPAALASISPKSSVQGANLTVTLNGVNTHFTPGATTVSFGAGINVGAVTVANSLQATAAIAVTASAAVGLHDVTVTTGSEKVTLPAAFTVIGSTPYLSAVTPNSGTQGQTLPVVFTGVNTSFASSGANATSAVFGSNIAVNSFTVNSTTQATANIAIGALAAEGERTGTLTVGSTQYPFAFTVLAAPSTAIASISPDSGPQGSALTLTVTGTNTLWTQANTTAVFLAPGSGCGQLVVNKTTINSNTSATLQISIPTTACVGTDTLQMSTGGEVVTGTFAVSANTPTLALSPSSAMPGAAVSVNLYGDFTSFVPGTTTAVISGQGVAISNFKVTSPISATATFTVASSALAGTDTVTLTTGTQVVTAGFSVATTPAYLLSVTPSSAELGATVGIAVAGVNTHFAQGTTTVTLGPNVTVSGVTVQSTGSLTATVAVSQLAALGWRYLYVNTGSEQVTIPFLITPNVPVPTIAGVSPSSGAQGQSEQVTITGANTHFVQGTTTAIVGAGVTVSNLSVTNNTTATATIAVSPTAPAGPNTVILQTGTEVASGGTFTVTGGIAQIVSVTLHGQSGTPILSQNETATLALAGSGTHWLQGETTANFGGGVVVDQLTVTSATTATAQVTVLSTAALGFQAATLSTDGESATIAQGIDIQAGTPVLLSANPNSGAQGTTVSIQVLGQFTHWQTGVTTATIGTATTNGVTATFSAEDSVTGVILATVSPLAYPLSSPGCDAITLTTGSSEQETLANQLCITPGTAQLSKLSPASAAQGTTATVAVTGQNTHFESGVTTANFGAGINAGNVTVTSPTQATVSLAVTTGAPTGFHTATLSTLGESASIANTFSVGPGVATLNGCSPVAGGEQGQTLTVHCIGQFTSWTQGTTTASFGEGITVNSVKVDDATDLDANVTISPLAFVGGRTVTVTTGTQIVSGAFFTVTTGPAIISGSTPVGGNQGQEIVLTITGLNTHWIQGLTQFSVAGAGIDITINNVIINSATSAAADVSIASGAALGARSIYMITAGEALADTGGFVVTGGVPVITYLSPNSGVQGATNLNVQINGFLTNWTSASTVDFGAGITVQSYTVNNATSITAVVSVGATAALGYRTVVVRTGTQGLVGAFQVIANTPPTPAISYESPGAGLPGQTFTVSFTGQNTHWAPRSATTPTQIVFGATGDGITVNSFQATSATTALANITIAGTASASTQTVVFTTGTESESTSFSIVNAVPVISIVDPGSGMQGATLNVNVLGTYTTFSQSGTVFNFGPGITVNKQAVLGPTVAQVNITIGQTAAQGGVNVTETTGSEVATEYGAFAITGSQATVTAILPNTAGQSASVTVTVTGSGTHWNGSTVFSLGSGITVSKVSVASATSATMTLTIAALATPGVYSVTATTGGEVATLANAFVVQPGPAVINALTPPTGQQGQTLSVAVAGTQTNFQQGVTTANFGQGVTVNSLTVNSKLSATANVTISAGATPQLNTVTLTTLGESASIASGFQIVQATPVLTFAKPSTGFQATTEQATVDALFTHFNSTTTFNFGAGITVAGVTITNLTTAQVTISISPIAALGSRNLTATTTLTGGGTETASGSGLFTVEAGAASISSISPATGQQNQTGLAVTVTGASTHFTEATPTVSFGPYVTVTGVSVKSDTSLVATISVSGSAPTGQSNVTVTTGGEVAELADGFTIAAGNPVVTGVNPASGNQGATSLSVSLTGQNTHFKQGTSTASFGAGITVNSLTVGSATSAVANIAISATAALGARNVSVTTGSETATISNGFDVIAGAPAIVSASPASAAAGATANVVVTGAFTSFQQGTTTVSFGSGIAVNSVTVKNATQLTANITVGATTPVGTDTITVTTGGQTETLANGFATTAGPPVITQIGPDVASPGSSNFTVAIAGLFTNWTKASTVTIGNASAGIGVGGAAPGTAGPVASATATSVTVVLTVAANAPVGLSNVSVTTGSSTQTVIGGFAVGLLTKEVDGLTFSVLNAVGTSTKPTSVYGEADGLTFSVFNGTATSTKPTSVYGEADGLTFSVFNMPGATQRPKSVYGEADGLTFSLLNGTTPPSPVGPYEHEADGLTFSVYNTAANVGNEKASKRGNDGPNTQNAKSGSREAVGSPGQL